MSGKNKLALGTVQFGVDYGISNSGGRTSFDEIGRILDCCKNNGINTIDTASLYGLSEEVLGKFDLTEFNVITKTVKIDKTASREDNFNNFKEGFYSSQKKLGHIELDGIMFHEADDLLSEQGYSLWELLKDFKDKNYVRKVGVSVYTPAQLLRIIDIYDIDIVQLPLNLLDQRFVEILPKLKNRNIEIHTRSTFLQGLLLMEDSQVSSYFVEIKDVLSQVPNPRLTSCLSLPKSLKEVDKIVVGTTKLEELQEIILMYNYNIGNLDYQRLRVDDVRFINPSTWKIER